MKKFLTIIGILIFMRILTYYLPYRTPLNNFFVNINGDTMTGNLIVPRLFISDIIYDHILMPANVIKIQGASNTPDWEIFRGLTIGIAFSGTTMEQAYLSVILPHVYTENTNIYPHFHISPSTNNSGNLSAVWCMEYTWAKQENSTFPSTTIKCIPIKIYPISHSHQVTDLINISGVNKSSSSILNIRIFRDVTNSSDNYTSDIFLTGFDVHYQLNRLGDTFENVLE